jgi:nicotinamide mononucleotide transporter
MDYLEIIGTLVGLLYLYLEYKASIYLWFAGVVMPFIYIYVFYAAGLYADMGINIYYLLAGLYGLLMWMKKPEQKGEERFISSTPIKYYFPIIVTFAVLYAGISFLLIRFTDSTVPYADGFVTALSIIGMWMLAYKYIEQWLVWVVVDIACTVLYVYKGLYPTSILYGLYSVIAVFGYFKWKKMMLYNALKDEKIPATDNH